MAELQPAGSAGMAPRPRPTDTTFSRSLRWELLDPEQRALAGSWGIAITAGVLWILFVFLFKPAPPSIQLLRPEEQGPVNVTVAPDEPPVPAQTGPVAAPGPTTRPAGRRGPTGTPRQGAPGPNAASIGSAFGGGTSSGGGMVGDVTGILRGVDVASGSGGAGAGQSGGGKVVLGYGQGGEGSRTPGRGGFGGGLGTGGAGGGGGIGGVGPGGGINRAVVRVAPPSVVAPPVGGGPGRDVGELGSLVRSRESQLRFCYQEYGLKTNPGLAGSITVNITLASSGSVTGVDVGRRTWSGAGASETESCIRSRIRAWRFPTSASGEGTYAFSFNFTPAG